MAIDSSHYRLCFLDIVFREKRSNFYELIRMGRTGLKVSELSLGTMTFGGHTDISEAERMLSLSFDAGINFIDTADAYGGGQSRGNVGKAPRSSS